MSSVSFPTGVRPGSPSNSAQESFFGSSYNPSSSFQINPLSQHPPRTPRSSIVNVNQSQLYGSNIYTPTSEIGSISEKQPVEVEQFEEEIVPEDVEESIGKEAAEKVKTPDVWREVFKTSTGRDKAFKIMQYSIKVYLLFHSTMGATRLLSRRTKTPWELGLVRRLEAAASGLSTTRKSLIMFNWLAPLTSILATRDDELDFSEKGSSKSKQPSKPLLHTFLHAPPPALLDLVNGLSDDIYAWYRLGLIGKKTGERAARFSDWCWFFGTLIALVELSFERNITKGKIQAAESRLYLDSMSGQTANSKSAATKSIEKELEKLHRQDYWLRIQRMKLFMDLTFVSYEVFNIKPAKDIVKPVTGLAAALLSTAKLYANHRTTLVLKQSRQ